MRSIEWSPNGGPFEESHRMNEVVRITCKPMVDALRKGDEVPGFHVDANPCILEISNVEVAATSKNESNFFCVMDMLLEE